MKLIGLLSLATAQRVQTLHSIKLSNIHEHSLGLEIFISDQIKTSKPGREQPCLLLPTFTDHPEWCLVRTIKSYIECTRNKREQSEDSLFISYMNPFKAVAKPTVSRWIKSILSQSGININLFSAHSTRHASTSAAARRGVDVDQIRQRAGWTPSSSTFSRFYNRPVDNRASFANALINQ